MDSSVVCVWPDSRTRTTPSSPILKSLILLTQSKLKENIFILCFENSIVIGVLFSFPKPLNTVHNTVVSNYLIKNRSATSYSRTDRVLEIFGAKLGDLYDALSAFTTTKDR